MSQSKEPPQPDLFGDRIDASVKDVLQHIDGLEIEEMKYIYTQRLIEFYDLHSHILEKIGGIVGQENHKLSAALVASIGNYFGGVSFYLPHNDKMEKFMRDIAIYKAFTFNGSNIEALSKKYRVSQQTIYTAIAKQRDARQRKLDL